MAVKRYDGSQWVTVAGKGDQGTSSSISTWVKTASGGETSLSGNDDNSQSLSYTVGQELVFINGTLLKRGSDYTATNGTSITGLTALAANDVATVWTVNAFSVTGAIANTIVDAKGDLLVGTAADTPGRLAVGTNGQVLTAASTTGTGLAWTTITDTNDFKLIDNTTFSAVTSFSRDNVFSASYDIYKIYIRGTSSAGLVWSLRFRAGGTDTTTSYIAQRLNAINTTVSASRPVNTSEISTFPIETVDSLIEITVVNPFASTRTTGFSTTSAEGQSLYYSAFGQTGTTSFDGYKFLSGGSETITGEQWVYGLKV